MVYFYYGTDDFRVREAADACIREAKRAFGWPDSRPVFRVSSDDADASERLFGLMAAQGLFDRQKIMLAERIGEFPAEFRVDILDRMRRMRLKEDPAVTLVLTHISKKDAKKKIPSRPDPIIASFSKDTKSERLDVLQGKELQKWIVTGAAARGVAMKPEAADIIAMAHPAATEVIAGEIEKLSLFAAAEGVAVIDNAAVERLGWQGMREDAFKLIDAIGAGNLAAAITILLRSLSSGENSIKLLGLMAYAVRAMLSVKDAQSRRYGSADLAEVTGLSPWQTRQYAQASARFKKEDLERLFERLLAVDYKMKTGEGDPRMLLERLLLSV